VSYSDVLMSTGDGDFSSDALVSNEELRSGIGQHKIRDWRTWYRRFEVRPPIVVPGVQDSPLAILDAPHERRHAQDGEEFFGPGQDEVDHVLRTVGDRRIEKAGRALDFGCGDGRLTANARAGRAFRLMCDGVDVAASTIDTAPGS
jgi:2-polyprenyl-3-methyl-5-hydroxy-6-metoxy-1,4-benzoquinol methylase